MRLRLIEGDAEPDEPDLRDRAWLTLAETARLLDMPIGPATAKNLARIEAAKPKPPELRLV